MTTPRRRSATTGASRSSGRAPGVARHVHQPPLLVGDQHDPDMISVAAGFVASDEFAGLTDPADDAAASDSADSTDVSAPEVILDAASPASLACCCGMDEVGRGALAGPLVAAAVILPDDILARLGPLARFLRDSKTVPAARRAEIAARIREHALALAIAVSPVETINTRGVGWANRAAFRQLIAAIDADDYVVDGRVLPFAPPEYPERAARVRCLVKADALIPAVSAASLVAKVYRDHLMATLGQSHPVYAWADNAGYGSPAHLAALRAHGPCVEHRTVFVATALGGGQRARKARRATQLPLIARPAQPEDV